MKALTKTLKCEILGGVTQEECADLIEFTLSFP
jgi:hypothetical protein